MPKAKSKNVTKEQFDSDMDKMLDDYISLHDWDDQDDFFSALDAVKVAATLFFAGFFLTTGVVLALWLAGKVL